MSWLEPRGKKKILHYRTESGISRSTKTNNQTIAKAIQDKWDAKLLRSENGLLDYDKTWAEYRDEYREIFSAEHAENSTVKLEISLKSFEAIAKPAKLMGIREDDCRRWRAARLASGDLPQTVDAEEKYLRPFFSSAYRNGYMEKDPFANIKRLDFYVPEAKELSFDAAQSFLAALDKHEPHYNLLGRFLYDTGMRLGEVAHQRLEDIDFTKGFLRVAIHAKGLCDCFQCLATKKRGWAPKKKKERVVPMTQRLQTDLLSLFQTRQRGNIFQIRERTIQKVCERTYDSAKLTGKLGIHTFRHTLGNELRLAGVDEQVRKAWLGHGKKSVHDVYQHVKEAELLDAVHRLHAWREEQRTKIRKVAAGDLHIIEATA